MRTAALPNFRKLYGRIEQDLNADDVVVVNVTNNYNTYSFGGKKKLILSTTSWLGGKNNFLGLACISVGSSSIFISMVFLLLHMKSPRYIYIFVCVCVPCMTSFSACSLLLHLTCKHHIFD